MLREAWPEHETKKAHNARKSHSAASSVFSECSPCVERLAVKLESNLARSSGSLKEVPETADGTFGVRGLAASPHAMVQTPLSHVVGAH